MKSVNQPLAIKSIIVVLSLGISTAYAETTAVFPSASLIQSNDKHSSANQLQPHLHWQAVKNEDRLILKDYRRLNEYSSAAKGTPNQAAKPFKLEYPIPQFAELSVIASDEMLLNGGNNASNVQNLGIQQKDAYIGIGYRLAPQLQIETGYLEQRVWRNEDKADQNNNVWMTHVNVNF